VNTLLISVVKKTVSITIGSPRLMWENNIRADFREIGSGGNGLDSSGSE
jgi:hypothetical protein